MAPRRKSQRIADGQSSSPAGPVFGSSRSNELAEGSSNDGRRAYGYSGNPDSDFREPPPSNMPSINPVHDGSFGVNTLIDTGAVDNPRWRPPVEHSDGSDDERFIEQAYGTRRRTLPMASGLTDALKASEKAAMQEQTSMPEPAEDPAAQNYRESNTLQSPVSSTDNATTPRRSRRSTKPAAKGRQKTRQPEPILEEEEQRNSSEDELGERGSKSSRRQLRSTLGRSVNAEPAMEQTASTNRLRPSVQLLPSGIGPEGGIQTKSLGRASQGPQQTRRNITTPYTQLGAARAPSEPPTTLRTPQGIPFGPGNAYSSTPARPDSARSFRVESGLFGEATIRTPAASDTSSVHQDQRIMRSSSEPLRTSPEHPTRHEIPIIQAGKAKQTATGSAIRPFQSARQDLRDRIEDEQNSDDQIREIPAFRGYRRDSTGQPSPQSLASNSIATGSDVDPQELPPSWFSYRKSPRNKRTNPGVASESQPPVPNSYLQYLGQFRLHIAVAFVAILVTYLVGSSLVNTRWYGDDAAEYVFPSPGGPSVLTRLHDSIIRLLPERPVYYDDDESRAASDRVKEAQEDRRERKPRTWEQLLPDLIRLSPNNKIPEDFWHAIRDWAIKDDIIMTLTTAKNKPAELANKDWQAIRSRMEREGVLVSGALINRTVDEHMSRGWATWQKQNADAIKDSATKSSPAAGTIVNKEEFIKMISQETQELQSQFKEEMREQEEKLKQFVKDALETEEHPPAGLSQEDVKQIVDAAIRNAINTRLDHAMAEAHIKGALTPMLHKSVNFFSQGSGAVIDPRFSSTPWIRPPDRLKSKNWLDRDGYATKPNNRAAALSPWEQEGDCFCAKANNKGFGVGTNNVSVVMSRYIIPQYLVVDHVLASATLDPGAMPREIEVWAFFDEPNLRERVRDFSAFNFRDTPREEVLHDSFVKIGHFTYQNRLTGDGVQSFKFSDDLLGMGAVTYQVVVRAINNYGADHTCFYRLRMFGQVRERDDPMPWKSTEPTSEF